MVSNTSPSSLIYACCVLICLGIITATIAYILVRTWHASKEAFADNGIMLDALNSSGSPVLAAGLLPPREPCFVQQTIMPPLYEAASGLLKQSSTNTICTIDASYPSIADSCKPQTSSILYDPTVVENVSIVPSGRGKLHCSIEFRQNAKKADLLEYSKRNDTDYKVRIMEDSAKTLQNDNDTCQSKAATQEKLIQQLADDVKTHVADKAKLLTDCASTNDKVTQLQKSYSDLEAKGIVDLAAAATECTVQVAKANADCTAKSSDATTSCNARVQTEKTACDTKVQQAKDSQTSTVNSLTTQVSNLTSQVNTLNNDLAAAKQQCQTQAEGPYIGGVTNTYPSSNLVTGGGASYSGDIITASVGSSLEYGIGIWCFSQRWVNTFKVNNLPSLQLKPGTYLGFYTFAIYWGTGSPPTLRFRAGLDVTGYGNTVSNTSHLNGVPVSVNNSISWVCIVSAYSMTSWMIPSVTASSFYRATLTLT